MKWKSSNYHMPLRWAIVLVCCLVICSLSASYLHADDAELTAEEQEIIEHLELLEMLEMLDENIDFIELSENLKESNDD